MQTKTLFWKGNTLLFKRPGLSPHLRDGVPFKVLVTSNNEAYAHGLATMNDGEKISAFVPKQPFPYWTDRCFDASKRTRKTRCMRRVP